MESWAAANEEQARYRDGGEVAHWLAYEERYARVLAPFAGYLLTPRPGPRLSTWTLLWSASSRSTRTPLATPARQHRTPHPEAS